MAKIDLLAKYNYPKTITDNELLSKMLALYNSQYDIEEEISLDPTNATSFDFINKMMDINPKLLDIKNEIIKNNINDIFSHFKQVETNQDIQDKYRRISEIIGIEYEEVSENIFEELDSQYRNVFQNIKVRKGTKNLIYYIYELAINSDLGNLLETPFLEVKDNITSLEYEVNTSLYKEVYDSVIKPLTHPIGKKLNLNSFSNISAKDYFNLSKKEIITNLTLIFLNNNNERIIYDIVKNIKYIDIDSDKEYSYFSYNDETYRVDEHPFGKIKTFNIEDKGTEFSIDFYNSSIEISSFSHKWKDTGFRLLQDYDGLIKLYSKHLYGCEFDDIQYPKLAIEDIRLKNNKDGVLNVTYYTNNDIRQTKSILFKKYAVSSNTKIFFEYKIVGSEDGWIESYINITDTNLALNRKYNNTILITVEDILKNSNDYNGRFITDFGKASKLFYEFFYEEKPYTTDISDLVREVNQDTIFLPIDSRDPYYNPIDSYGKPIKFEGDRNLSDNTLEETDNRNIYDNFARLVQENIGLYSNDEYKILPIFDIARWVDYPVGHKYYPGRIEGMSREPVQDDVRLAKIPYSVIRYENDNIVDNKEYVAWEANHNIDFFSINNINTYEPFSFIKPQIGDKYNGKTIKINQQISDGVPLMNIGSYYYDIGKLNSTHSDIFNNDSNIPLRLVNAEVYKSNWNYKNGNDDNTETEIEITGIEDSYIVVNETSEHNETTINFIITSTDYKEKRFIGNMFNIGEMIIGEEDFYIGAKLELVSVNDVEIFDEDIDYNEDMNIEIYDDDGNIVPDGNIAALES